jgi:hypothetical protein
VKAHLTFQGQEEPIEIEAGSYSGLFKQFVKTLKANNFDEDQLVHARVDLVSINDKNK